MDIHKSVVRLKLYVSRNQFQSAVYAVCGILVLIPLLLLATLIVRYSVNVPWWDQLPFVNLMDKLHQGTLTINDLWRQHNEHRIVVAQAYELAVGGLTGFNFRIPVFLNLVTAAASFVLLISLLRRSFQNNITAALLAVPFAWLVFTPFQWVNWIWGFQLAFFLCIFWTVFSIWLLTAPKFHDGRKLFVCALIAAAITTYCNGNGMLIWPIGLAILWWRRANRQRLYVWCGVAVAVLASYFYKFQRASDSPRLSQIVREPVAVLKYTFTYLGRNLSETPTVALYAGITLVVVFVLAFIYVYKRDAVKGVVSWTGIAAYVLLTALLAAASRLNQGVIHSFNSNSAPTISLLFIVATLAVVSYALKLYVESASPKQLRTQLAIVFMLGVLVSLPLPAFIANYGKGYVNFKDLGTHLVKVQHCVYTAQSKQDPCLLIVFPDPNLAWNNIQVLKRLHWGGF